ncbi:MAG: VWA domain-containing protein [Asticcacaulis sp.]|uniref:VWA domain-containing protein n=1 Tax=Asticcacaulis sp. TaxID=1872648 RepID=UPI003F7BF29E
MTALLSLLRRLVTHRRGNVTMIFSLSALMLVAVTGGAIDMANMNTTRGDLQDAADAAALRGALTYNQGLTAAQTAANTAFLQNFGANKLSGLSYNLSANTSGNITQLTYTVSGSFKPLFLGLIGMGDQTLHAESKAQSQVNPFELVFVLDTTGSMAGTRISNLKSAVGSVLDTLYSMEGNNSKDVKIGVAPFDTQVRIASGSNFDYIDYSNCASHENGYYTGSWYYGYTYVPGVDYHACLAVWDVYDHICDTAQNPSSCQSTASPALYYKTSTSGDKTYYTAVGYAYEKISKKKYNIFKYTETYYIDPTTLKKVVTASGLTTSSAASSSGYVGSTSGYTNFPSGDLDTIANSWTGCLSDRTQDFDASAQAADASRPDTLYIAASCAQSNLTTVKDMTNDITSVKSYVNNLTTNGNTNITVGLQFGMEMLSPDAPYTTGVSWTDEDVDKYMILVTDGANTQNRWTSTTSDIDARTKLACQAVKDQGVTLFVVNIIEGDSTLLQNCASQKSYYYNLTSATELGGAMQDIHKSIGKLRLVH